MTNNTIIAWVDVIHLKEWRDDAHWLLEATKSNKYSNGIKITLKQISVLFSME